MSFGSKSAAPRLAQQTPQGYAALFHQGQAEIIHVLEMSVERSRNHADFAGHFAQAERREAAPLTDQVQRRLHQLLARAQFAGVPADGQNGDRRLGQQSGHFRIRMNSV